MRFCSVGTEKYDLDLRQLLKRRLERLQCVMEVRGRGREEAGAEVSCGEELSLWCRAVSELLTLDLAQLELACMVNELPISISEKKSILPEAIRLSRKGDRARVYGALMEHFKEYDHLVLEGFMAFRMKEEKREWERCVIRAADELLLNAEYMELMQVLAAFVRLRSPRMREIYVILNPDGSCTFTDDNDVRIDYERCTEDGIMSVLVGLAPERITVYDMSGGRNAALAENLMRVFDGRVRFFR